MSSCCLPHPSKTSSDYAAHYYIRHLCEVRSSAVAVLLHPQMPQCVMLILVAYFSDCALSFLTAFAAFGNPGDDRAGVMFGGPNATYGQLTKF
ncbi:unnamed protein product [Soboliphyme baturini]|uniref:Uncharacterized protein n=1 Tax=Soboliphyme baturini TaxID=241478 RepID=A0A183IPU2_9BILA|nr:unnamed protein product [Soboliphyme baturini]